jgi:hypothetical protein
MLLNPTVDQIPKRREINNPNTITEHRDVQHPSTQGTDDPTHPTAATPTG